MNFPVEELTEDQIACLLQEGYLSYSDCLSTNGLFALIERFGGTSIRVPLRDASDSPLREALSPEDYKSLRHHAGGIYMDIPVANKWKTFLRGCAVLKARDEGKPVRDIARELGMTTRNVYLLLQKHTEQFNGFPTLGSATHHDQASPNG